MCKSYTFDKNLYNTSNIIPLLHSPSLITNAIGDDESELIEQLEKLFGANQYPQLSPYIVMWIEKRLLNQSVLTEFVRQSFKTSMNANIYNFAIAKCFQYLNGLNFLSNTIDDKDELIQSQKQYSNLVFSTQQTVEDYQTQHMTELINTVDGGSSNLLEYVSERDGKVRPTHKAQDGTIADKQSKYWNDAIALLSEWNCRCTITEAPAGAKMTPTFEIGKKETKNQPSEIDFQKGKAIIYSQNLPVFDNVPTVVRQRYKKNGF